MRPSSTLAAVADLDRSHPAVTTLAALADVDPRTALAWLHREPVKRRNARRLADAVARAALALPEHAETYAARVSS